MPSPERHPVFAALYDLMTLAPERGLLTPLRADLLAGVRGRVLEIGCGTGANFPFYRQAADVVATEPDPEMARRARRRLGQLSILIELVEAPAESLPFANASFDTAVSTLVLCTVKDPQRVLYEVRRVLLPGGLFLVMEHVQAHPGTWRKVQDALTPIWRVPSAGCHLNRPTLSLIEAGGFRPEAVSEISQGLLPIRVGRYRAV